MEICVMQDLFNRPRPTTRLPNAKEKNTVSQCPWDEKQSELRRAIFFLPRRQVRTQAAKIRPKSARNPLTIPSRRVTGILI